MTSARTSAAAPANLVEIRDLTVHFPITRGVVFSRRTGLVRAVDGVDMDVVQGRTLGLVGESGCGKSTLGRAIVGLTPPTGGSIRFPGRSGRDRRVQMIFQDPYASLNPRMTIGACIGEPIRLNGLRQGRAEVRDRTHELLEMVGLAPAFAGRYPHEFSGGQRQRVGIARALACEPDLIVCDEAISGLDVSIQAQIIVLLEDLRDRLGLTLLFIAHDIGALKHISDDVAVMYLGRIVEQAPKRELFANPRHAYTRSLLSAIPVPDPRVERRRKRILLQGDLPSPATPPAGCRFHTRCPVAIDRCRTDMPPTERVGPDHDAACWRARDLDTLIPDPVEQGRDG